MSSTCTFKAMKLLFLSFVICMSVLYQMLCKLHLKHLQALITYPYLNAFPLTFKTLFKPIYVLCYCFVSAISLYPWAIKGQFCVSPDAMWTAFEAYAGSMWKLCYPYFYTTIQNLAYLFPMLSLCQCYVVFQPSIHYLETMWFVFEAYADTVPKLF